MQIRHCSADEFLAIRNVGEVIAQYAAESKLEGMPEPHPNYGMYRILEASGLMTVLVSTNGEGDLEGFAVVLVSMLPHYGELVASIESFYVVPEARQKGLGNTLTKAVEVAAKEKGAVALILTAAIGSPLEQVLKAKKRFRHSHNVFLKAL